MPAVRLPGRLRDLPRSYQEAGHITRQYNAWLAYWHRPDWGEEQYTAHGSLKSAQAWMREITGCERLHYEASLSGAFYQVYARNDTGDDEP